MSKDILKKWTIEKIKSNPKLYGGDNGNPAIIQIYLAEFHGNTKSEDLTYGAISTTVKVSRIRNQLLKQYPRYDSRIKNKPKS